MSRLPTILAVISGALFIAYAIRGGSTLLIAAVLVLAVELVASRHDRRRAEGSGP